MLKSVVDRTPLEVHLAPDHKCQTENSQLELAWCGLQGSFQ